MRKEPRSLVGACLQAKDYGALFSFACKQAPTKSAL